MAFYYNWGIHPNQGGPLVFAALLEHILVTVDDAMILRLTLMDIKNSESHINILTLDTRLSPNEVKNVFIQDLEIVFGNYSKQYLSFLQLKKNEVRNLRKIIKLSKRFIHPKKRRKSELIAYK